MAISLLQVSWCFSFKMASQQIYVHYEYVLKRPSFICRPQPFPLGDSAGRPSTDRLFRFFISVHAAQDT